MLTVSALKELIKDLPDNTRVVVPSFDHSYRDCYATQGKALYDALYGFTEWYDHWKDDKSLDNNRNKEVNVLIIE